MQALRIKTHPQTKKGAKPNMKPVACYLRVSTENQRENYSIPAQRERLLSYCKARDYAVSDLFIDNGFSGGNVNRPALTRMLRAVEAGACGAVLVYKLDRLSRSQKDTLTLIEDHFLANGVDFISVCENFDTTTPFGRAMIGMLSVFAQLEKEQITERFTMGRIGRCRAGFFHGGANAPKGYRYAQGMLLPDPAEAEAVRLCFARFLAGHTLPELSRELSDRYGSAWNTPEKLRRCLQNSVYCGQVKFAGTQATGKHPPLISEADFLAAQRRLLEIHERHARSCPDKAPFRAGSLLSGLLICGRCGARYSANHGFYKCYSRAKTCKRFIRDPNCDNPHHPIEALDAQVRSNVRALPLEEGLRAALHARGDDADGCATDRFFAALEAAPLARRRSVLQTLIREIRLDDDSTEIFWRT